MLVHMFLSVSMLIAQKVDDQGECDDNKLHSRLALTASRLLRALHRVQDTAFWDAYQEAIMAIILRLQAQDEFKLNGGRRDNTKLKFDPGSFDAKLDNAINVGNKGKKVSLTQKHTCQPRAAVAALRLCVMQQSRQAQIARQTSLAWSGTCCRAVDQVCT